MKTKIMLILVLFILNLGIGQESKLPSLHTNSLEIDLEDGIDFYPGGWAVDPKLKVDIWEPEMYQQTKKVTFYSDVDQITFTLKENSQIDFMIIVNERDTAYTRIKTLNKLPKKKLKYGHTKINEMDKNTIPFRMGVDNRIHFSGKINNSKPLDFLFDTGANTVVIRDDLVTDGIVEMTFDKMVNNQGSDGITNTKKSTLNYIRIENFKWQDASVLSIPYKKARFEAVAGWTLFENQIVEINYSNGEMVIHKILDIDTSQYTKLKMRHYRNLHYIELTLLIQGVPYKGWFEYDTGATQTLIVNNEFTGRNSLKDKMQLINENTISGSSGITIASKLVLLPELHLGGYEFYQVPITLVGKVQNGIKHDGILGNNFMKRFDVIIDYQANALYIKPNKLIYTPF